MPTGRAALVRANLLQKVRVSRVWPNSGHPKRKALRRKQKHCHDGFFQEVSPGLSTEPVMGLASGRRPSVMLHPQFAN